jgi:hypothetical protein
LHFFQSASAERIEGLYYTPLNPEEVEVEVEVDPTQQAPYGIDECRYIGVS